MIPNFYLGRKFLDPAAPADPPSWVSSSQFFLNTGSGTYFWPTHQAGDFALLIIGTRNEAVGAISGWTFHDSLGTGTPGDVGAIMISVYTRVATSGSEANVSVPDSGAITGGSIMVFRDCSTIEDSASTTGATTSVSIPAATASGDSRLIVHALVDNCDATGARLSGWANASLASITERLDVGSNAGIGGGAGAAVGTLAAAGSTGAATATHAASGSYAAMTLVLAP